MRRAILSDIHGNLEALQAVLADAQAQGVEEYYCLGDIVGYGPNPVECVDLVRNFAVVLQGEFEDALSREPEQINPILMEHIHWSREQLATADQQSVSSSRLAWLASLPHIHRDDGRLYVHGTPRDPLHEYLFPEDIYNEPKIAAIFATVARHCFHGKSHIAGIILPPAQYVYALPEDCQMKFPLPASKMLCNVGSVGQPRDGDPRACYVILTDDAVLFRRVEYPVEETARKLRDLPWF